MSDTDNKAPREFTVVSTYVPSMRATRYDIESACMWHHHVNKEERFKVIEKSYADNLQSELERAQQIAWDRKCDLRTLQSRLEKCEGLLREAYEDLVPSDELDERIYKYFAEVEK